MKKKQGLPGVSKDRELTAEDLKELKKFLEGEGTLGSKKPSGGHRGREKDLSLYNHLTHELARLTKLHRVFNYGIPNLGQFAQKQSHHSYQKHHQEKRSLMNKIIHLSEQADSDFVTNLSHLMDRGFRE